MRVWLDFTSVVVQKHSCRIANFLDSRAEENGNSTLFLYFLPNCSILRSFKDLW